MTVSEGTLAVVGCRSSGPGNGGNAVRTSLLNGRGLDEPWSQICKACKPSINNN